MLSEFFKLGKGKERKRRKEYLVMNKTIFSTICTQFTSDLSSASGHCMTKYGSLALPFVQYSIIGYLS
jgi:hypothetical protein